MAKAIYTIDNGNQETKSESDANAQLFAMHAAYTKAAHDDQVKRAALISDILENSFLKKATF